MTGTSLDLKCLPARAPPPPAPMPRGVYDMVTQLCFRSWEEFCQGTTRISKSQRSFCRERRRGESGSQARLPALPPSARDAPLCDRNNH